MPVAEEWWKVLYFGRVLAVVSVFVCVMFKYLHFRSNPLMNL